MKKFESESAIENALESIVGWIDWVFWLLSILCIVGLCVIVVRDKNQRDAVVHRVYCTAQNGRPDVLFDGEAQVTKRTPYVTLIDAATGRQVLLVNATCRISEKDPE